MSRWRLALLLLAGVAYAGLSHWMMLFHAAEPWAVVVLLVPLWLTALGLAAARFGKWALLIVAAAGAALFVLVLRGEAGDPNRLYVLQHAGINLVLCIWFGSTLRGEGLSLIGQFAQRVHAIVPGMKRYTDQVTLVWTVYFALMVVASIVVYLTLPFSAWSLLANVLTPVSVACLFVGEHFIRYRLHPEFERTRMIDAVRAFYGAPVDNGAAIRTATMQTDLSMRLPAVLPLLGERDLDAPLAWRAGVPVSSRQYLTDVIALAEQLPVQGPVVNLCVDRYAFAVGLGAALVRGLPSLLPPDARPETLSRLHEGNPHLFALADDKHLDPQGITVVWIDPRVHVPLVEGASIEMPMIEAEGHAVSLLTSGSTGVPQPHAKSWRTLVEDVGAAVPRLAELLKLPSLDGLTLVTTVPVQHSYGLESSALLAMLGGASFDSGRPFFPADVTATLEASPRPRALITTPFHLKTLLLAGIALPPVDLILSATAPLSPQLAAQAEHAMGGALIEIYGSTESGQVATRRTTESEVWHTFGDIQVTAEPTEDGTERFVFSGDFIPRPTPMSDVLELIDSQHFRLFGRANDLIHVAGRRSSLGHLNYHLNSVAGVVDGAFWLPDEVADGVVRPVAFVVAPELKSGELIAALRLRLEPVFVPRRVVHVTSLPREGTGKLTVRALREFALAQLADDGTAVQVTRDVPVDHPAFAGHFPEQPLVPGALLLAEVLEAAHGVPALIARLGRQPTLAACKFLSPVRPGATLTIELQPEPGAARGVRFEVRCGVQIAVSGRWTPGADAAA